MDLSKCEMLKSIGIDAFSNCGKLEDVDLSGCAKLTSIGGGAFQYCTSLKTINLSKCAELKSIGGHAFSFCKILQNVDLSGCAKLTSIGKGLFLGCTSITIVKLEGCTDQDVITTVNKAVKEAVLEKVKEGERMAIQRDRENDIKREEVERKSRLLFNSIEVLDGGYKAAR